MNAPSAPEANAAAVAAAHSGRRVRRDAARESRALADGRATSIWTRRSALHRALPQHKQLAWVMRRAVAERRCLTQPRGGFGTFALQLELMETLDREGLADVVPTTTDSYTRNEQFALAQHGVEESERAGPLDAERLSARQLRRGGDRRLIDAIDKPAIMLTGTAMPKLTGEIGFAAGYSGYLGSGIAYTTSYIKEMSIEDGIRNYQYLDRLAAAVPGARRRAAPAPAGLSHRHQHSAVHRDHDLRARLPARRGAGRAELRPRARPDAAPRPGRGGDRRLRRAGAGIPARSAAIPTCSRRSRRCTGWAPGRTTTRSRRRWSPTAARSPRSAARSASPPRPRTRRSGIPTPEVNAEGLRMTRMAIYLARHIRLDGLPEFEFEKDLIKREVRPIVDKVLEMGDGDVAVGTVRAFAAGVLDVPWSPNRHVKSRVMPARDADGCLRILDAGPDAVPQGRAGGARGALAAARRPRRRALQRRAGGRQRVRAVRAAVEADVRQVDAASGVSVHDGPVPSDRPTAVRAWLYHGTARFACSR